MGTLVEFIPLSQRKLIEFVEKHGSQGFSALHRIFAMASCNGAKSVVVENEPDDREYSAEHEALFQHVTAYRDKKKPVRFHLFADEVFNEADLRKSPRYLGFIDLRPFREPSICWAILDKSILCGMDGSGKYLFLTCCKEYEHEVGGIRFQWKGFPYLQQEGVSVRCAQAALAIIANYLDCNLTGPDFTKRTALDSENAERAIPSAGLTARQICLGIRAMDRDPLLYTFDENHPKRISLEEVIYPYIESRIPVLIGIRTKGSAHALVATGHTFTPDSWMPHSESAYYGMPTPGLSTGWVRRFVVQDDNFGPYTLIPTEILRAVCFLVAVPLPAHIYFTAEDAVAVAKHLLSPKGNDLISKAYAAIDSELKQKKLNYDPDTTFWKTELEQAVQSGNVVLRPRLVKGEDLKSSTANLPDIPRTVHEEVIAKIEMPEYVWRIEISWPQIFCHQRLHVGELVLDATHSWRPNVPPLQQGWIWLRIPGGVAWQNVSTNKIGCNFIAQDLMPQTHYKHI